MKKAILVVVLLSLAGCDAIPAMAENMPMPRPINPNANQAACIRRFWNGYEYVYRNICRRGPSEVIQPDLYDEYCRWHGGCPRRY